VGGDPAGTKSVRIGVHFRGERVPGDLLIGGDAEAALAPL
jgi:hypothetical protein